MRALFGLDGRAAIVTGASRGLGAAIAEALVAAGASVVVTARDTAEIEARAEILGADRPGAVLPFTADVTDEGDVAATVEHALERIGRLDIVVNNAGINIRGPIHGLSRADFERSMAVNVTGPWLMCRAAEPHLAASSHARVVNVASTFGLVAAADRTPYTTAKGALVQLTRALALEWAPMAINVNAIAPGPFLTEMNRPFEDSEHTRRVLEQEVALRRWGEVSEIQGAALYLASDASSYTTGSVITVDGGWTAH